MIETAINNAVKNGVLVIAAAGNSGPSPDTISYPGALQNVVAVAALENVIENNSLRIADFSSRGSSAEATVGNYIIQERDIEVSAPGRNVESTWNDGGYNTISGTSMATPHISGLAAKIWSEKLIANQSYTAAEVRSQLQSAAKSNDILGGISASLGDDIASGFGFPHQE
ncbi:S8 family serine peptidase [Paenibacillus sp. V4I9]|uniref:S8 family serine peptidase n=1 Tax=Paenibacillus sp. V4I9 TaxID=3042308 RepID=UPI0027D78274|nr:S8 family serine peptidase [Paenibacillus sp. V4I9]